MRFNSKLIHAGWDSDENSEGSITVPITEQQLINLIILNTLQIYLD